MGAALSAAGFGLCKNGMANCCMTLEVEACSLGASMMEAHLRKGNLVELTLLEGASGCMDSVHCLELVCIT